MATAATTYIQLDASYTRCTGCVPRKLASEYFGHYGECTACQADAWLDVSETQRGIDQYAEHDTQFAGVVADFGRCKETCTADQWQSFDRCVTKKSAGESCGGSSQSGTCASGLCGGSYCCDADAAASSCSKPCEQSTGICSSLAAVGEACSSDADCYDTNANWCHTDTNLCAVHSDWGGACVTNDHCKNNRLCLGGYCCNNLYTAGR